MKIRNSFVSNSSSASFIVNLKINNSDIFDFIMGVGNLSFWDVRQMLQKRKDHFIKVDSNKEPGDRNWDYIIGESSNNLDEVSRLEMAIKEETNPLTREELKLQFVKLACSVNHMYCHPMFDGDDNDVWRFTTHVTMYNDFSDVPDIMRDLIVSSNFQGKKITCEVQEDD